MSEKLRLTCVCGYENWIRPDQLGQTVECAMCGADLVADEAAMSGHFDSPDAETIEDETAPESPTSPPHRQATPDDGLTLEERVERARQQRGKPLSPFDADDDEIGPPPRVESRIVAVPGQPRPRVRNPFEADEPQEEKRPGAGPFTMAPDSRTRDGASYSDLMEETRPKEKRERHVAVPTISPHDAPSGEKCAECGRDIRGAWDRIETEKGVICYICSNQAVQGVPERVKTGTTQRRELNERDLVVEPVEEEFEERVAWYKDTESLEFKRVIFFLAVLTLMLAGYFFFFDDGAPVATDTPDTASIPEVEITPFTGAVFQAWHIFSFVMSLFLGVYASLRMNDATPHGRLVADVLLIGAVCVPLAVFYFFAGAVSAFLSQIPMAGGIFVILIGVGRWLIIYLVLTRYIYMRLSQVLIALVIYLVLRRLVFAGLGVLIFRAMGIL